MERDISLLAIILPVRPRPINESALRELTDDIRLNYLRERITVRRAGHRYRLLDGLYRVEAFKRLGHRMIPARIIEE